MVDGWRVGGDGDGRVFVCAQTGNPFLMGI